MFFGPVSANEKEVYAIGKDVKKRKPHSQATYLRNSISNLDSEHDSDLPPITRSFSGTISLRISNEKEALQLIIMKFFENQSSYRYFSCVEADTKRRSVSSSATMEPSSLRHLMPTKHHHSINKLTIDVSSSRSASTSKRNCFHGNYHCYYSSLHIQAAQVFRSMDIDYNNKLTYAEFERGLALAYSFSKRLFNGDILRRLFLMFDINKDGFIDFSNNSNYPI
jgi:hypothetical protein